MLTFPAIGVWNPSEVRVSWTVSTRPVIPEVEQLIDQAWQEASQRPGIHLFDGPMCRLELLDTRAGEMHLTLSRTSYKPFMGTNLSNAHLADKYGPHVLANPVGLSALVISRDGFLMLGRRNETVAYYPGRVHPFSGALEPRDDLDVFNDIRRELSEELALQDDDLDEVVCIGMAMDMSIRQPELIFLARPNQSLRELESRLDPAEHRAIWSAPATVASLEQSLTSGENFTPVAIASLLLWGRTKFGNAWFEARCT